MHDQQSCAHHPGHPCGQLIDATRTTNPQHRAALAHGCHYDYAAQVWIDGHDHAHACTTAAGLGLLFCGADLATCSGSVGQNRTESGRESPRPGRDRPSTAR